MMSRVGQTWEVKSYMNGERVIVVMNSRPSEKCVAMIHEVLQITGKKFGRVLVYTEYDGSFWEQASHMTRLD